METIYAMLDLFAGHRGLEYFVLALVLVLLIGILFAAFFLPESNEEQVRNRLKDYLLSEDLYPVEPSLYQRFMGSWTVFARHLVPRAGKEYDQTLERLRQAGFRSPDAIAIYYSIRMVGMLIFPFLVFLIGHYLIGWDMRKTLLYAAGSCGIGMIGPSYFLDQRLETRQTVLRNALPDALDLIVVCSEAGLSLNSALVRVAREIQGIHPVLALEFLTVTSEIQGGLDREQALNNMFERTGVKELKSLILIINQTLRLGTSVAETLRSYSDEYRETRRQAAEEKAAKLSTKMIFPLVFCFLPCFFIVSVGPGFIKLIAAL